MSVSVTESVLTAAANSLYLENPTSEMGKLLDIVGFVSPWISMDLCCRVPLCMLQYLHEKSYPIPASCVFIDGLKKSSISFWVYVFNKRPTKATELLDLLLKHGDSSTRCVAKAFYEPLSL